MITLTQNRLVLLLEQSRFHPLALEAEAAFRDDRFFELPVAHGIPIEAARRIYKVRAEINRDKHCGVQGYEELIDALDATSEARITIQSFMTDTEKFNVFSDAASKTLMGILKIPISFQDYLTYTKLATRQPPASTT